MAIKEQHGHLDVVGEHCVELALLALELLEARFHLLAVERLVELHCRVLGPLRVLVIGSGVLGELGALDLDGRQPPQLRAVLAEEEVGVQGGCANRVDENLMKVTIRRQLDGDQEATIRFGHMRSP